MEELPEMPNPCVNDRVIVEILPHIRVMANQGHVGPHDSPAHPAAGATKCTHVDGVDAGVEPGEGLGDGAAGMVMPGTDRHMHEEDATASHQRNGLVLLR